MPQRSTTVTMHSACETSGGDRADRSDRWREPEATGNHGDPVGWAWIETPCWVEFDLDSDLLAGWLADAVSNHGLLLRGEGSGNREVVYWFFSREVANADVQPQLVVGYDVP